MGIEINKVARAPVHPKRQRSQYTCMATSLSMGLMALGIDHADEDTVNKVMGAAPMRGAAWEHALACANHFGCISTLRVPATVRQLKEWCDEEIPVLIAWNPEGRDWSHASLVFDVTDGLPAARSSAGVYEDSGPGLYVWVADPNIPHPEKTYRVLHEDSFYGKWHEKWPNYLVRRPACAVQREVTPDGRQVLASRTASADIPFDRFYKGLDAIRKKIEDAHDFRILDLAVEHVPVYVRGGVQRGMLPKSFRGKYNKMLRGLGTAGLSSDIEDSKVKWYAILDAMRASAQRLERKHSRTSSWADTPISEWGDQLLNGLAPARGINSRSLPTAMSRYAFELGAAGERMPDWLRYMGTLEGVNVHTAYRNGTTCMPTELLVQRVASRYLRACGGSCGCGGACGGSCGCNNPQPTGLTPR